MLANENFRTAESKQKPASGRVQALNVLGFQPFFTGNHVEGDFVAYKNDSTVKQKFWPANFKRMAKAARDRRDGAMDFLATD
ncbi:MAG TPA: hypothetical protein VFC85_04960 [Verrucomicrobiae bacterium]|nr:hypothetical protein [Verrucomicrobiae bacterium]